MKFSFISILFAVLMSIKQSGKFSTLPKNHHYWEQPLKMGPDSIKPCAITEPKWPQEGRDKPQPFIWNQVMFKKKLILDPDPSDSGSFCVAVIQLHISHCRSNLPQSSMKIRNCSFFHFPKKGDIFSYKQMVHLVLPKHTMQWILIFLVTKKLCSSISKEGQ